MEHVVLLHGIGANSKTLIPLSNKIKAAGFIVHNLNYSVHDRSLESIISSMQNRVNSIFLKDDVVHFVGHSLGGIIARGVMSLDLTPIVGKLITLGSPHKGALMAKEFPLGRKVFAKIFGEKIIHDLTSDSTVSKLPYPNTQIGTISGSRRFHLADPVSWFTNLILDEPHDGFISLRSTQLEVIAENIVLDVDHCFMVFNKDVMFQTIYFLKFGTFSYERIH
jgi:pimeloyl-ACP methyl ester carboxylesterase